MIWKSQISQSSYFILTLYWRFSPLFTSCPNPRARSVNFRAINSGWSEVLLSFTVDLISTKLPTRDKSLDFQPSSLLWTLSTTNWKARLFLPLWRIGNSKYLPRSQVAFIWSRLHIASLVSSRTLGEKKIFYFSWQTFWLNSPQNSSSTSSIALQFWVFALVKRRRSYAKNMWENLGPFFEALTFSYSFSVHFLFRRVPRNPIQRMKI